MSLAFVSSLVSYPLKSSAPLDHTSAQILKTGIKGDRRFMLCKMDGQFITGRTHPEITQIQCQFEQGQLTLSHPSCEDLSIEQSAFSSQYYATAVWGSSFLGQGCGFKADQWVSQLLNEPLRMLYFGEKSERKVLGHPEQEVAFADGFPFLLANDQSLAHLNQRLIAPVSMANFRPNITFSGVPAWAEDEWQKIRIGEVVFELAKPCSRCIFTTVDPHTAALDLNKEPLKTLTSYRKEPQGNNVIFGENMLALNEGTIKLGDRIEVLETKAKPLYIDQWQAQNSRVAKQLAVSSAVQMQQKELVLRCIKVIAETSDVKTFVFSADPVTRFSYFPGQFITITAVINGESVNRCYTLSSSPSKPDTISITVKRVAGGLVSNWLHDNFNVGSCLQASAPSGVFHLSQSTAEKILLLSAGSGITPMLSVVRYINDLSLNFNLHFHHSAKTEQDLIAFAELQLIAQNNPNIRFSYNISRQQEEALSEQHATYVRRAGRLTSELLAQYCADYISRDVFVCGPEEFMSASKEMLLNAGLAQSQYNEESFVVEHTEIAEDMAKKEYKVTFLLSDIEVLVPGDQTIIQAAEAAGIYPDYSCLSGVCGSCTAPLISGEVFAPDALAIDVNDPDSNDFLPCCSYPRSDLQVEL